MDISIALPQSSSQSVVAAVVSRLKSLVSATTDREAHGSTDPRPYSFLSECACPADCLRDHENE